MILQCAGTEQGDTDDCCKDFINLRVDCCQTKRAKPSKVHAEKILEIYKVFTIRVLLLSFGAARPSNGAVSMAPSERLPVVQASLVCFELKQRNINRAIAKNPRK